MKITKDTEEMNQVNLTHIKHLINGRMHILLSTHALLTKIDYFLGHKKAHTFKGVETLQRIFFLDHNGIKLEIINMKISRKIPMFGN